MGMRRVDSTTLFRMPMVVAQPKPSQPRAGPCAFGLIGGKGTHESDLESTREIGCESHLREKLK